jgi:hypothetical protein
MVNLVTRGIETNLFCDLHRWAKRQDENFVTEAFAHLLRYFMRNRSPVAVEVLRHLSNVQLAIPLESLRTVSITTQATIDDGRPDLEIATSDTLLYVEVKVESGVRKKQLRRYRQSLGQDPQVVRQRRTKKQLRSCRRNLEQRGGFSRKYLILLTRYPPKPLPISASPDHATRWIKVAECLDTSAARHLRNDRVGAFLVQQFTSFLASRNIAMRQIDGQITNGLQAIRPLLLMAKESLLACGVQPKAMAEWDCLGYYCEHEGQVKKFWVGIDFKWPLSLWFQTGEMQFDRSIPRRLDIGGEVEEEEWDQTDHTWVTGFDLSPDNKSFFAASASEQFHQIEAFLKECINKIRLIEQAEGT